MIKPKHIPIRTCVACRTADAKRGLMRVVRLADGSVVFDPKGKTPGRGAYVCARQSCIAQARKQKKFERSLKADAISDGLFEELELQAARLGPEPAKESTGPAPSAGAPSNAQDSASRTASVVKAAQFVESVGDAGRVLDGGEGPQESEE